MEIFGYIASILIGLVLGLMGGGGSILTLPVLVYLFGIDPVTATSYSLFIIGSTSLIGSLAYFRDRLVRLKTAFTFGIPSIFAVYITRSYILPAIPESIFELGNFQLSKNMFLMILFAVLMLLASTKMIQKPEAHNKEIKSTKNYNQLIIIFQGLLVGVFTGLVGAGGGFLIVPALVLISGLPMKEAVGTSLVIISMNSLLGFTGDLNQIDINWKVLLSITTIAISGIIIGTIIAKKINGDRLKPIFGWFVLLMGVYILTKELFF